MVCTDKNVSFNNEAQSPQKCYCRARHNKRRCGAATGAPVTTSESRTHQSRQRRLLTQDVLVFAINSWQSRRSEVGDAFPNTRCAYLHTKGHFLPKELFSVSETPFSAPDTCQRCLFVLTSICLKDEYISALETPLVNALGMLPCVRDAFFYVRLLHASDALLLSHVSNSSVNVPFSRHRHHETMSWDNNLRHRCLICCRNSPN